MGPKIVIWTVNPLQNAENGYDTIILLLIWSRSRGINEKSWNIGFLNIYFKLFFSLSNNLFVKHPFQTTPFETNLYHIDMFHKDKIFQTSPI